MNKYLWLIGLGLVFGSCSSMEKKDQSNQSNRNMNQEQDQNQKKMNEGQEDQNEGQVEQEQSSSQPTGSCHSESCNKLQSQEKSLGEVEKEKGSSSAAVSAEKAPTQLSEVKSPISE